MRRNNTAAQAADGTETPGSNLERRITRRSAVKAITATALGVIVGVFPELRLARASHIQWCTSSNSQCSCLWCCVVDHVYICYSYSTNGCGLGKARYSYWV